MSKHPSPLETARLRRQLPSPAARRDIRRRAGLSQADLAEHLGVSAATVGLWESGQRRPSRAHLRSYVDLLEQLQEL